jgi:hypothetical protein
VSRPGRGVVDEETCPIVCARGCSAGFIGQVFSRLRHQSFRPDQSGAVLGASALSRAHINRGLTFCQRYSRTGRKRRTESLKTCSSPRLFISPHPEGSLLWHDRPDTPHTIINAPSRGPCAGDIDQPPLASSAVHREVPALAESTTETVTVVAHGTRWHPPSSTRTPTSVALPPPPPGASPSLVLRPLGASPPWRLAPLVLRPLGLRPDVRPRPVTRGAQPVGLLDKTVKRTPLVLRRPEEDDEDNPPA